MNYILTPQSIARELWIDNRCVSLTKAKNGITNKQTKKTPPHPNQNKTKKPQKPKKPKQNNDSKKPKKTKPEPAIVWWSNFSYNNFKLPG